MLYEYSIMGIETHAFPRMWYLRCISSSNERSCVAGITDKGRYPVARYLELDRSNVPDGHPSPCKTISQHDSTFYSI